MFVSVSAQVAKSEAGAGNIQHALWHHPVQTLYWSLHIHTDLDKLSTETANLEKTNLINTLNFYRLSPNYYLILAYM